MSRRLAVLGTVFAVAATVPVAGAVAAPHSGSNGQRVTINVTPNPVVTGTPLTIYGQLNATHPGNRQVVLYHRVAGQPRFTVIQRTRTDATGLYRFARAEGIVRTNRAWFVRAAGSRSRTVRERVSAEVTLTGPSTTVLTNHAVDFAGAVTPGNVHRGNRIVLQQQTGAQGDSWHTVDSARIQADGKYTIAHRFAHPGSKTLRTLLRRDKYNIASTASPVSVTVEQAQRPGFTIGASAGEIQAGQPVTISGVLAAPNNAGQTVTLFAHGPKGAFRAVATTATSTDGHYSFTQSPIANAVYQVRTGAGRHTALLFVGVHDVVSVTPSATTATVGGSVSFTGGVLPNKAGHVIYLQQKGDDGAFHTVQVRRVGAGSRYTLTHTFSTTGTKQFRVVVPGGPVNQRGVSEAVTITVS